MDEHELYEACKALAEHFLSWRRFKAEEDAYEAAMSGAIVGAPAVEDED